MLISTGAAGSRVVIEFTVSQRLFRRCRLAWSAVSRWFIELTKFPALLIARAADSRWFIGFTAGQWFLGRSQLGLVAASSGVVEITNGKRLAHVIEPLRLDLLEARSHTLLDQKQALSQGDWSADSYASASSSDEVGSPRGALHS